MGNTNIIISNVSAVNLHIFEEKDYILKYDGTLINTKAKLTNEAPIVCLAKYLDSKEECVDRAIVIASDTVEAPVVQHGKNMDNVSILKKELERLGHRETEAEEITHLGLLKYRINMQLKEKDIDYWDPIRIKDEPQNCDVVKAVYNIKHVIEDIAQNSDHHVNIYVEANGGVRYVAYMLITVLQMLEENHTNITIKAIYNMVLGKTPIEISNTIDIYKSVRLVSVTDELLQYGRSDTLKKYFDALMNSMRDESVKEDIQECIYTLDTLTDNIQLCRTQKIRECFDEVPKILDWFINKYKDSTNENVIIFRDICDNVLEVLRKENMDVSGKGRNTIKDIIRWLNNKSFVQQALTMCAESLPNYFFENKYITFSDEVGVAVKEKYEKGKRKKKKEYEYYYWLLHHNDCFKSEEWIRKKMKQDLLLEKAVFNDSIVLDTKNGKIEISIKEIKTEEGYSLYDFVAAFKEIYTNGNRGNYYDRYFMRFEDNDNFTIRKIKKTVDLLWLCGVENTKIDFVKYDRRQRKKALLQKTNNCELIANFEKLLKMRSDAKKTTEKNKANRKIRQYNDANKIDKIIVECPEKSGISISWLLGEGNSLNDKNKYDLEQRMDAFLSNRQVNDLFRSSIESQIKCMPSEVLLRQMSAVFEDNGEHQIKKELESVWDYTAIMEVEEGIVSEYLDERSALADIFYLYGFLKEQRNKANHAYIGENDGCVLNSRETKRMICLLIDRMDALEQNEK